MAQKSSTGTAVNASLGQRVVGLIDEYKYPILFFFLIVGTWTAVVRLFSLPVYLLPTPFEIIGSFQGELGTLYPHARITLFEAVVGWAGGSLIGILLGLLMAESTIVRKSVYPYVIMLRSLPVIAIAPLLILWLGVNIWPILAAAALTTFFPALVNSIAGFGATDQLTKELMHSYDASRLQVLRHVKIYNALPYIFSALKINVALSLVGAVVGEWLVANRGLGYMIIVANNRVDTLLMFRSLILIGLMATVWFGIILYVESKVINWAETADTGAAR